MVLSKLRSASFVYSMVALGVVLVLSACGGSSSTSSATTTRAAVVSSTSAAAPKPRLKTLSPRVGSHIGSNVTVRVALVNGVATGPKPFRYILDGQTRFGPRRLVFHGVKPGHHHLIVMLVEGRAVRSQTRFVVKAPPAAPVQVVTTPATTPAAPPAPAPSTPAAPAPTAPAPAPAPPTMTSPAAGGGVPQGDGGDHDGDNNGGPSDGDGNI
jgi:hypothetical protein